MLVVIAIIAVLAALLMPALQNAKESGRRIQCMGNLRQIYMMCVNYSTDNDGWFPPGSSSSCPDKDIWFVTGGSTNHPSLYSPVGTNGTWFPKISSRRDSLYQTLYRCPSIRFGKLATYPNGGHCSYMYFGGRGTDTSPQNEYGWLMNNYQNGFTRTPRLGIANNAGQNAFIMDNTFLGVPHPYTYFINTTSCYVAITHSSKDGLTANGGNIVFADGHGEWISNPYARTLRFTGSTINTTPYPSAAGQLRW